MKIWFFTETAYPYLPETYESIRVVLPNRIYEPRVGAELYHVPCRKAGRPGALVVVAPDGAHRGNASERFQDGWVTDVATMNNEVRSAEGLQCFEPNQAMSI